MMNPRKLYVVVELYSQSLPTLLFKDLSLPQNFRACVLLVQVDSFGSDVVLIYGLSWSLCGVMLLRLTIKNEHANSNTISLDVYLIAGYKLYEKSNTITSFEISGLPSCFSSIHFNEDNCMKIWLLVSLNLLSFFHIFISFL
jgi:hypothetical protein